MHNNHADERVTLRSYYAALPEKNNRIAGTRREKHFSFIQPGNRFEGNVNAHSTITYTGCLGTFVGSPFDLRVCW